MEKIGIKFGAFAKSIKEQLQMQGYKLRRYHEISARKCYESILTVQLNGLCTDLEAKNMKEKLLKTITKNAIKLTNAEKLKIEKNNRN